MTFSIEKERIRAIREDGILMGHILFPRVRAGLVNIQQVAINPEFRSQGIEEAMLEALLSHLTKSGQKAALTASIAQQYVGAHPEWKHILPGEMHFTRY